MPKVKNYLEQEAIDKIKAKNLLCDVQDVQRVYSTEVAKGYVIECSPQEGTEQEIRTHITLIVSAGPAPEQEEVPNVVGSSFDSAKQNLEALGFTTKRANVASAVEAGKVIGTDPLAGNKLTKGSLITIQVSDGSKIVKNLVYDLEKDLPSEEYAEIAVKIILNEDGGKNTVLKEVKGIPGEGMKLTIDLDPNGAVNDQKFITVMIDNVKYETLTFDFKKRTVTQTYRNTNYKVKQKQRDPLLEKKDESAAEILAYPDYGQYSSANRREVERIVEKYVLINEEEGTKSGLIYEAGSVEELRELVEQAKEEIDDVDIREESSEDESSEEESSEEPSVPKTLDEIKADAISSIQSYAESFWYSDESWKKVEKLFADYSKRINAAENEETVQSLEENAKRDIDAIPKLNAR